MAKRRPGAKLAKKSKAPRVDRRAVHYRRPQLVGIGANSHYRSACWIRLTKFEWRRGPGARQRVRVFDGRYRSFAFVGSITCAACLRWLELDEIQRNLADLARASEARDKIAAVRSKVESKTKPQRDKERAARAVRAAELIAEHEDHAQVAVDAYLSDREYPLLRACLEAAMVKHRRENPTTRGKRLWYFRQQDPVQSGREIACRFCDGVIGKGCQISWDYSASWFTDHGVERGPENGGTVSVRRHTTLCALAYLACVPCVEPLPRCPSRWEEFPTECCVLARGHRGPHKVSEQVREFSEAIEDAGGEPARMEDS